MYLLGLDVGSSSIKAALVDMQTCAAVATSSFPNTEMPIQALNPDWAEQDPDMWWEYASKAIQACVTKSQIDKADIKAIGISYQMHGLVVVDIDGKPLRPSIIWCDSRAIPYGEDAESVLGNDYCSANFLNSPGNFTASKLKWVKENEPDLFDRIHKMMLPGDYIAYRMTGDITTTVSGLSEGILWNFSKNTIAASLLGHFKIDDALLATVKPTFSDQGQLHREAAKFLGLPPGIPVTYRAGDQPNNAMSLGVFEPGQIAGTGGTSGVVYAISDKLISDPKMRVNSFAHVNHSANSPRVGVLLCINGCGIQYGWMRKSLGDEDVSYFDIERKASEVPIGSEGLSILSFGNGAERMLQNRSVGGQVVNLNFNVHQKAHLYRAALEGIAFSFYYGIQCMSEMGIPVSEFRVGNDNLFQSSVFSKTLSTLSGSSINVVDTTGAIGAALGAGVGLGHFLSLKDAFNNQTVISTIEPENDSTPYSEAYQLWLNNLQKNISET
jgi:xylulokinase